MSLYSSPPPVLDFEYQVKPTLLVCWWITAFCTTIILLRVSGRFVRSERLFREDKTVSLAILTLFLRMACVHVILLYGTNNANFAGMTLSDEEIRRRRIASGLVLASRMFYAATLWILKNTILEYFKRFTDVTWDRSYESTLLFIRVTLVATFCGILISDLAECQPFNHYWQVVPDPGGRCRQGYAQLLTMGVSNIVTDLLLVFFPIPIIVRSKMTYKRKVQLIMLFSLSLGPVGVTLYRLPHVVWAHGSQQLRSLLASVELLFATAAANALVLGSFVRDRGVKKAKFKYGSIGDSMERSISSRRPTLNRHWGSDENLVRDIGLGVSPELRDTPDYYSYSPGGSDGHFFPPPVNFKPAPIVAQSSTKLADDMNQWSFAGGASPDANKRGSGAERSDDSLLPRDQLASSRSNSTATPRKVSFWDVGGLLSDDGQGGSGSASAAGTSVRRDSAPSTLDPLSPHSIPSPSLTASGSGFRRGSTALLQDLGGLLSPFVSGHQNKGTASPTSHPSPQLQQGGSSGRPKGKGSNTELQPMSPASASNNQRDGASGSLGAQTTPTTQRERELAEAAAYERERRRVQDRRELSERPELVLMDPGGLLKQQ